MRIGHAQRHLYFTRLLLLGAGALIAAILAPRSVAAGQETVLYSFCAQGGTNCTDGALPLAGLIMDRSGHLYGTTSAGGAHNNLNNNINGGTVFELGPNAAKTAWTYRILHNFCVQYGCPDGSGPVAGLIMDAAGHLYGTTTEGGANCYEPGNGLLGCGTVFELTPPAAKTGWTEKVLYSFCAQGYCSDGQVPEAGVIMDAAENFYGTTYYGEIYYSGGIPNIKSYAAGTVFELTHNARKTIWKETVLHSSCVPDCRDGEYPNAGLIMDGSGNLYGTTSEGGTHNPPTGGGTVFKLTPNAAGTTWTYSVLYNFCARGGANCTDGKNPKTVLIEAAGHFYGTTYVGGAHNGGTVFELTPNATPTKWTETVLYSFCAQAGCTDGVYPEGGVIRDAAGDLYGTTMNGGTSFSMGTVFELRP